MPDFDEFQRGASERLPWLPPDLLHRLCRAYGTALDEMVGSAATIDDLGWHFGAGLYEAEVRYLIRSEFARTAEDILWRRTKLGLRMSALEQQDLADWMKDHGPS